MKGDAVALTATKLRKAQEQCAGYRTLSDPAPRIPLSVYRQQIAEERKQARRQKRLEVEARGFYAKRQELNRAHRAAYLVESGRAAQAVSEGLIVSVDVRL